MNVIALSTNVFLCIFTCVHCQLLTKSKSGVAILGKSCTRELDDYGKCLDQVQDDIDRRFNNSEKLATTERIRKCLLENGCGDPLDFVTDGLAQKEREQCMIETIAEAKAIVSECVHRQIAEFPLVIDQPSLDDDIAEMAKSEFPTRGPWGIKNRQRPGLLRLAIRAMAYLKNSRICDVTANMTGLQFCLSRTFRVATDEETVFDQVIEAEQKFNFYCSGRDRCRQWMSESCQRYLDDGKAATCRCAKLELLTQSAQLSRTFDQCIDKDSVRHFVAPKVIDDMVRTYCTSTRDPCIENFPPRY